MNTRKIFVASLLTNALVLMMVAAVFAFTQTAQAQPNSAPAASNPQSPTIGPFYQMYSGADFVPYRFDFSITRDNYAVVRQSAFGIGVVGLHLPPGAAITELVNDSENTNGTIDVLLLSCALGGINCTELGRASQDSAGRAAKSKSFNVSLDMANNAYFLQLNLPNNSKFYSAQIAYTLPSSALFMPAISR